MSGSLASITGAVATLFGAGGQVSIGGVVLSEWEVPERIQWGGSQALSEQVAPGGVVATAALGIRYRPIEWSGICQGPSATARSRLLYAMMAAGQAVSLSWFTHSFKVIVERFEASDEKRGWIPYRISCRVQQDNALAPASAGAGSLLGEISDKITSGLGLSTTDLGIDMGGVQSALQVAQRAATAVGSVVPGTGAFLGLSSALSSASSLTQAVQSGADTSMLGLIASAGSSVFPGSGVGAAIANISNAVSGAEQLAKLPVVSGFIKSAQSALSTAST